MPDQWVVLLEAEDDGARDPVHAGDLNRLLEALEPGPYGGALDSPERYALQVTASGAGPVDALLDVVARWTEAVRQLGIPAWKLVRTEVFTPEDLEREFDGGQRWDISIARSEPHLGLEDCDDEGHELLHRAFSDPLTGLLGRHEFEYRLGAALAGRHAVAVVCLGLDGIRDADDRFGGSAADEVLAAVARRLAALLRPADVLARLGGDQFGVLLTDSTADAALAVAERLLDSIRLPLPFAGQELTLLCSAGVALSHPDDGTPAVLESAEAALGAAKAGDGGSPVLYSSDVCHPAQTGGHVPIAGPQDRLAHLQLMQQAAVAANENDGLHEAAQVVMRHICSQIGCAVGHLWVSPDPSRNLPETPLWHVADGGDDGALLLAAQRRMADVGLPGRVMTTGRSVWIADLADDGNAQVEQQAATHGLRSAFAFPVMVGREVVAVFAFFSRTPMEGTGSFLDVIAGIGTQLGRVVERQRAVEALRRSANNLRVTELRLREAEALTRLGSWHFDLRTGAGTWSDGTGALYGMDPQQPHDLRSALAAVHADDRPRIDAALSLLIDEGVSLADEIRVVRPDGQIRWHRAHGSAIRDDNGVVVALQGTSQDITEAKLAHEALADRERLLAEAQRAARLGCWELELSSGRLIWSQEMYTLWGWEPDREVTFEAFLATVHPDDRQRLLEAGARLQETGEPRFVDFRATVADGRECSFRRGAHMLLDEEGRALKLFGTDQDITEQKQAEDDLRRTKALYQRIVETSYEGILTLDSEYAVTFVNPRMAQILGYSIEEMIGLPVVAIGEEQTYALLAGHRQRRRQGMSEHYPSQLRTKNGDLVQVLVSDSPIMDDKGDYIGSLAMVTDISAVREAEDILRWHSLRKEGDGRTGLDDPSAVL